MKKRGWQVFGTEVSLVSASTAKRKVGNNFVLINKNLEDMKNVGDNFDIITLWHVLEHLAEPKKIINLIEEKLINKGFVVIEVPNFNSLQHWISKNKWIYLDCPRHLTHFTRIGLENFIKNKKFKTIKSSTLSLEFGFYGMLQSILDLFVPFPNYLFFLIRKKKC